MPLWPFKVSDPVDAVRIELPLMSTPKLLVDVPEIVPVPAPTLIAAPASEIATADPPDDALIARLPPPVMIVPLSLTDRDAVRVIAEPEVVSVEPEPIVMSELAPVVVTEIAPLEVIDPSETDWALLSVNAPIVPDVVVAPVALAPVKLTVPAPLSWRVAAVSVPAPLRVAPLATAVVAVPAPTFQLPDSVSAPELTVVAPV